MCGIFFYMNQQLTGSPGKLPVCLLAHFLFKKEVMLEINPEGWVKKGIGSS